MEEVAREAASENGLDFSEDELIEQVAGLKELVPFRVKEELASCNLGVDACLVEE